MKVVGNFSKVSFDQFVKDWKDTFDNLGDLREIFDVDDHDINEDYIAGIYGNIKLPTRSTVGSAGYDFVSPLHFCLEPEDEIKIPTGIRVEINKPGWALMLFPRSGLGFKYHLKFANTIPVIDSDYAYSENEGHIFLKIRNEGSKTMVVEAGDKIVQGVFLKFGITSDDNITTTRNGGFGSTGR